MNRPLKKCLKGNIRQKSGFAKMKRRAGQGKQPPEKAKFKD
jgi:hypothetical protein